MPRTPLEIVATASQAAAVVNSFSRDLRSLEQQAIALQRALNGITVKALGGIGPSQGLLGGGGAISQSTSASLSKYGEALKVVSQANITLANGMKIVGAEFTTFHGKLENILAANAKLGPILDAQNAAMDRAAGSSTVLGQSYPELLQRHTVLSQGLQANLKQQNVEINAQGQYVNATSKRWVDYNGVMLNTNTSLRDYINIGKALKSGAAYNPQIAAGSAGLAGAIGAPPELPFAYNQLNKLSPQLLRRLQGLGLGGGHAFGTPGFAQNIADSGGYESLGISKDLVNNMTSVTGRFKDAAGFVNTFTAQIDKSGNVITKFGGRLSGISNILNQVGRDFQKVAEYAIATTTIFAAYQAASQEIGTIISLDKSLAQVGITANLSGEGTKKLFNSIADIAISTATPLKELVSATDDAALATRKAGQSTEEWQHQTLSLINSVGILTNLTGKDTVSSTDLLVSSMKQLGLQADELPTILNKIAAVAGGQSTAIADITQGLGVMAEAGKQAGLTIDQMIATVQTLSQVTAKSPDEVATAFKNLVGSLTSAGSIKALQKYGISIKDEAGNLRNILDVYTEINQKITSGAISAGNVQQLVKAIAGGPRRAPDAAALLGAVGGIQDVTAKSIGATNEALIANQKILDTTAAKLVQLGVEIDKFAFSKFGEALKGTIDEILTIITNVLQFFNNLPASIVSTILKFAGIAIAVRVIGSGLSFLKGVFQNFNLDLLNTSAELDKIRAGLQATAAAQKELAIATEADAAATREFGAVTEQSSVLEINNANAVRLNTVAKEQNVLATGESNVVSLRSRAGVGAIFNSVKGSVGSSIALGAITAGATLASNPSNIGEGLSQFAQSAGIGLLATAPLPQLKALGAVLTIVGFGIEALSGNTKKETAAEIENAQAVLANVTAYTAARDTVKQLDTTQSQLGTSIDALSAKRKKTSDDLAQLSSSQSDYADNTLKLVDANGALATSFQTLRDSLPGKFRAEFDAAQQNLLDATTLHQVELDATAAFLKQSNPGLINPNNFKLPGLDIGANNPNRTGSSIASGPGFNAPLVSSSGGIFGGASINLPIPGGLFNGVEGQPKPPFDLTQLSSAPDKVKQLFDANNQLNVSFDKTTGNFTLINTALDKMKESGGIATDQLNAMVASVAEVEAGSDSFGALSRNLLIYSQYIQTQSLFGQLTADQAQQATKFLGFYGGLSTLIQKSPNLVSTSIGGPDDRGQNQDSRASLQSRLALFTQKGIEGKAGDLTKADFIQEAKDIATANGQVQTNNQLLITAGRIATNLGVHIRGLTDTLHDLGTMSKAAGEALDAISSQGLTDLASRSANLLSQLHSGSISPKEFGALFAESQQAYKSTLKLGDSLTHLQAFDPTGFSKFVDILRVIPGFEDAVGLSAGDITTRFTTMLITLGLTSAQIKHITNDMIYLDTVAAALSEARAVLKVDVDTTQAIAGLKALIAAQEVLDGFAHGGTGFLYQLKAERDALAVLEKAAKNPPKTAKQIAAEIAASLKTGKLGLPKDKAAKNQTSVSLLDIPQDIADSSNESSIIKQAIANAKRLRNQIPGETKKDKNDIVELLDGTKKVAQVRGISEELLRKALDELSKKIQKQIDLASKADVIQRIRIGSGSFAALANVPLNSQTGASVGGPNGPVSINLNINGQLLTPAQFDDLANLIGAALKKQLAGGG